MEARGVSPAAPGSAGILPATWERERSAAGLKPNTVHLDYPDASCHLNSLPAQFLAPTHGKFALWPPHSSGSPQPPTRDHALAEQVLQYRFMEPLLVPRGE